VFRGHIPGNACDHSGWVLGRSRAGRTRIPRGFHWTDHHETRSESRPVARHFDYGPSRGSAWDGYGRVDRLVTPTTCEALRLRGAGPSRLNEEL
jgi:hypothetical protein